MLYILSISLLIVTDGAQVETIGFSHVDRLRYEEGKTQYAVVEKNSQLPKYGKCWKEALIAMRSGCKSLTDETQSRLALAYLNCFLVLQGRELYECDDSMTFEECTYNLKDSDSGSLATFFTHTQNICYFLESQIWHEETARTINRLSISSDLVADQLERTGELQKAIITKQEHSLENQFKILETASNLNSSISASSKYIENLSSDLKKTTEQQKLLMKLQTIILNEISGFSSIAYYFIAMIIAYIVTSSSRTASARLWLFGIITVNVTVECLLYTDNLNVFGVFGTWIQMDTFGQDSLYYHHWFCRKISAVLCLIVLAVCVYRYQDVNQINNRILMEIRKQNSDIHKLLQDQRIIPAENHGNQKISSPSIYDLKAGLTPMATDSIDSTGYDTDSAVSTTSSHLSSDHLAPQISDSDTELDIYTTAPSTLADESSDTLHSITPIRDLRSPSIYPTPSSSISRGSRGKSRSRSNTPSDYRSNYRLRSHTRNKET